jgi:hypothetical protein
MMCRSRHLNRRPTMPPLCLLAGTVGALNEIAPAVSIFGMTVGRYFIAPLELDDNTAGG